VGLENLFREGVFVPINQTGKRDLGAMIRISGEDQMEHLLGLAPLCSVPELAEHLACSPEVIQKQIERKYQREIRVLDGSEQIWIPREVQRAIALVVLPRAGSQGPSRKAF
jgi:hypothetical protein